MSQTEPKIIGNYFDIQKYSIHDGKGIRTILFLKGCPLHCLWCSNPESQNRKPELFYIKSKCIKCGNCIKNVPDKLVEMNNEGNLDISFKKLNLKSLDWVSNCPSNAMTIKGNDIELDTAVKILMEDENYYRQSNGGITLSGGEPMLQIDFIEALLKVMHAKLVNTAIETSGAVPFENFDRVLPYVDLFLYDLKLLNGDMHKKFTGCSNVQIISNLEKLVSMGKDVLVRTPVIPGVNATEEIINKNIEFLKNIGVKKYMLLPFHQYGRNKYESMGKEYLMEGLKPPDDELMDKLHDLVFQSGLKEEY